MVRRNGPSVSRTNRLWPSPRAALASDANGARTIGRSSKRAVEPQARDRRHALDRRLVAGGRSRVGGLGQQHDVAGLPHRSTKAASDSAPLHWVAAPRRSRCGRPPRRSRRRRRPPRPGRAPDSRSARRGRAVATASGRSPAPWRAACARRSRRWRSAAARRPARWSGASAGRRATTRRSGRSAGWASSKPENRRADAERQGGADGGERVGSGQGACWAGPSGTTRRGRLGLQSRSCGR